MRGDKGEEGREAQPATAEISAEAIKTQALQLGLGTAGRGRGPAFPPLLGKFKKRPS